MHNLVELWKYIEYLFILKNMIDNREMICQALFLVNKEEYLTLAL